MIVTLGEIVVEILADTHGGGFREPQPLTGPFASGAPAIFIDQVAHLGYPAGLVSCVGDDDFGRLTIDRLRADGVDVSAIGIVQDQSTGSAFVRYRDDGTRRFVFNIRGSAASQTRITDAARALLARCRHLHIMGSSLFSEALVEAALIAVDLVKRGGGTVSFDPNARPEMLADGRMREALQTMLARCDLFLPSGSELTLLTEADTDDAAIAEILRAGVPAILVKQGADGATYHDPSGSLRQSAFPADEIDPTGAGDCFGATFVTCRALGHSIADSLRYAAASGALAVGVRGPMEGAAGFAQLERLITLQPDGATR